MRWTEEQTLKFVMEYIKYECLCNINCAEYRNKQLRDAALLQISKTMHIPDFGPKEVYLKIRSLKSTYSQELKRVKNSQRSGAGTGDIYKPNVKWFSILYDALTSMSSTGECRETSSNLEPLSPPEVQLENNEPDERERSPAGSATDSQKDKEDTPLHKTRNMKKNPGKRTLQNYDNLLTKVQNVANVINKPDVQSEFEFAAQLKNMPLDTAIEAQMFIQNYLSEIRLTTLRRTMYNSQHSSASSSQSNYTIAQPSPSPQTSTSPPPAATPTPPSTITTMDLLSQAWYATNNEN